MPCTMDIEECDYTGTAGIVTGSVQEISVTNTAAKLQARSLDTSFAAAYFPDCLVRDPASGACLLYTSPSPRDNGRSRMPSSA